MRFYKNVFTFLALVTIFVIGSESTFGATAQLNSVYTIDGVNSTSTPVTNPFSDLTANYTKYVTLSSSPTSATSGHNYFFSSGSATSAAAYQVPTGKTLIIFAESWLGGAATAEVALSYGDTAVTYNQATDPTNPVPLLWDGTNGSTPFMAPSANTWYKSNWIITIPSLKYPYMHAGNTTQLEFILNGILVP